MKTKISGLFFLLLAGVVSAQMPIPNSIPQKKSVLLMNGYAHLGTGEVIENSLIGFKDGKITLVADATRSKIDPSTYDTVINIQGKHVYPGFISPNSTLGLIEIGAVRATNDLEEVGGIIPNVRSLIAYNTDSKIIPTVRTNGILIAQITPRGNTISGTSSVMHLDGWNWEDAVLKKDDGVHLNWPTLFRKTGWWAEPGGTERNKNYDKQRDEIVRFFADARAYREGSKSEKNLLFEGLEGVFYGKQTLFIHANHIKQITEAVHFAKNNGIKKMVIVGGRDAWMVTSLLKENNIPVMFMRVHELPDLPEDDVDQPFKTPYQLKQAGILYCLENEGDMEQIHVRNLPFYAGTTIAYGLSKEEALMSITLNAAKILGIDNWVGSLEEGKQATLFISTGDALDIMTNDVIFAWIQGRKVDLNNEQKLLYEIYKKKYGK
jgi:hypothetical protein